MSGQTIIDRVFKNKRNVFIVMLLAIAIESVSSVFLKFAGNYQVISLGYILFYIGAVFVMGIYAILWQLLLEHLPLTTAYLRKGLSYILVYVWAFFIFGEKISPMQWVGTAIIIVGMIISQRDKSEENTK